MAMVTEDGVTEMLDSVALVTPRVAVPLMLALVVEVAVMVAAPGPTPVATPLLLMVAMLLEELDQVTGTACEVPSEKVPMAVNACVVPPAMLAVPGDTAMLVSVAEVTLSATAGDVTVPDEVVTFAVMLVLPTASDVARPPLGEVLEMVAAAVFDETQVAVSVSGCVEPSE